MTGLLPRIGQFAAALCAAALAFPAVGQAAGRIEPTPDELKGVGVDEKLGNIVPLDAAFHDEEGREVKLGDYFRAGRPVILNLGYYRCPMLCSLVLNGLVDGMKGIPGLPGDQFEIVTVSVDPLEMPTLAKAKKENYIQSYGRPGAGNGWHFLVGDQAQVTALADSVGFRYRLVEDQRQFAHPAVLTLLSPQGKVARYLYGVTFPPQTLRLALAEASEGKTRTTIDQIMLFCFHYDATARKYSLAATNLMRAGGVVTALAIGTTIVVLARREKRRRRSARPDATT